MWSDSFLTDLVSLPNQSIFKQTKPKQISFLQGNKISRKKKKPGSPDRSACYSRAGREGKGFNLHIHRRRRGGREGKGEETALALALGEGRGKRGEARGQERKGGPTAKIQSNRTFPCGSRSRATNIRKKSCFCFIPTFSYAEHCIYVYTYTLIAVLIQKQMAKNHCELLIPPVWSGPTPAPLLFPCKLAFLP